MGQHRIKRVEEEIQHAVSSIVLFELTDPGIRNVTITRVIATKDLSLARIYYDVGSRLGLEDKKKVHESLRKAQGFVRRRLAERMNFKKMPEIEFFYDETLEETTRVEDLFSKL